MEEVDRPPTIATNSIDVNESDPTRSEDLVDELRQQLQKAEIASEQYRQQLAALQKQVNEALDSRNALQAAVNAHAETLKMIQGVEDDNSDDEEDVQQETTLESQDKIIERLRSRLASYKTNRIGLRARSKQFLDEFEQGPTHPSLDSAVRQPEPGKGDPLEEERAKTQQLEATILSLKDENAALSQYINRIVVRLMDSDGAEELLATGSVTGDNPLNAENHDTAPITFTPFTEKPTYYEPSAITTFNQANTNPDTAISIPFRRNNSVRRKPYRTPTSTTNASSTIEETEEATHPGSASRQSSTHRTSPAHHRNSLTTDPLPRSNEAQRPDISRTPSDSGYSESFVSATMSNSASASASNSASTSHGTNNQRVTSSSSDTRIRASTGTTPPRAHTGSGLTGPGTLFTAAGPGTANKIRPLRLVQEKAEEDEMALKERKKANRGSWWFGKGTNTGGTNEQVE